MERIEIPFNRERLGLYSLILLLFVALFVYITLDKYRDANGFWDWLSVIIYFLFTLLVIWPFGLYFIKLISLKSGLIVTEHGVINRTSLNNWGFIEWEDIYNISGRENSKNYLIELSTCEQEKYAANMNPMVAWCMLNIEAKLDHDHSPTVNASLLSYDPIKVEKLLIDTWHKYRKKSTNAKA